MVRWLACGGSWFAVTCVCDCEWIGCCQHDLYSWVGSFVGRESIFFCTRHTTSSLVGISSAVFSSYAITSAKCSIVQYTNGDSVRCSLPFAAVVHNNSTTAKNNRQLYDNNNNNNNSQYLFLTFCSMHNQLGRGSLTAVIV